MGLKDDRPSRATRMSIALLAGIALVASACSGTSSTSPTTGSTGPSTAPASGGAASPGGATGGSISVYGVWGGSEQDTFLAVTKPWSDKNGTTVQYTGTRDIAAVLQAGAASGILPDVAALSTPGLMAELAGQGVLQPLDAVLSGTTYQADTAPGLYQVGVIDGTLYALMFKPSLNGLIWYNTNVLTLDNPPATFDDLQGVIDQNSSTISTPWCE